jgi:hypothetical protein
MSTKIKIILCISTLVMVLAIIIGWFYWFQWRPTQAIKTCSSEWTFEYVVKLSENYVNSDAGPGHYSDGLNEYLDKAEQNLYNNCMAKKGFKK